MKRLSEKLAIIVFALFFLCSTGALSEDAKEKSDNKNSGAKEAEKKPEQDIKEILKKLKVKAIVQAPSSGSGTDFDNKYQTVKCKISISNESRSDVDDWSGEIYLIGKSVAGNKDYRLLKIANVPKISVQKGKKYTSDEQTCRVEYDSSNYAKFGHKYDGCLLVLKDSSGAVVMKSGVPPKYERIADKIMELKENSIFDEKGTFLENYYKYSRY